MIPNRLISYCEAMSVQRILRNRFIFAMVITVEIKMERVRALVKARFFLIWRNLTANAMVDNFNFA